jgi:hypothetical protein
VKLPVPVALAFKVVDGALSIAIKVDAWLRERKQREPKGLRFRDVKRINEIAKAAGREQSAQRSRAPTVVLPKKP